MRISLEHWETLCNIVGQLATLFHYGKRNEYTGKVKFRGQGVVG